MELLLVLLILAILILTGFGQYRRYQKHKNLEALKHNILILKEASNVFYHHQCVNPDLPFKSRFEPEAFNIDRVKAVVPFQLLESGLVNSIQANSKNVFALEGYELYAEAFGAPIYLPKGVDESHAKVILYPYRLKLKVTLSDHLSNESMVWYQSVLGATEVQGKQLIWDYLPKAPKQKTGNQLWIMETGLQQFRKKATENFSAGRGLQGVVLQCAY